MDNFLDTCVVLATFDRKDKFHKNSKEFVTKNDPLIISIYQEKKEITFLFFRKEKIITEAIKVSAIPTYHPNLDKLTIKDQIILKKIIARLKLYELSQQELFNFKRDLILLRQEITYFINNKISRKVIPLDKIDSEIVSKINNKIKNEADSNIISSAIQEHQDHKLIIITNDIGDWEKDLLLEVTKGSKYKEVPEIKYLF